MQSNISGLHSLFVSIKELDSLTPHFEHLAKQILEHRDPREFLLSGWLEQYIVFMHANVLNVAAQLQPIKQTFECFSF